MSRIFIKFALTVFALSANAYAVGDTPVSFTLDGTLYDSPAGTRVLHDASANLRIQILPPSGSCVLYDEQQTIDTTGSEGAFSVQVGTIVGSTRRLSGSDSANSMATVFQNKNPIPGNASGCTYSPLAGDSRRVRLIVTPTSGAPDVLTPDMVLSSVPSALVAQTLQGVDRSGFLQLGAGSLTQSNAENIFSATNYPALTSLLAGGSPSSSGGYAINAGTGGSGGIDFNVNGSTKVAIANDGNFSVDGGSFYVNATTNRVGIGTSTPAASLDLGAQSDAVILPNGTTAQRPSPASAGMIRFNATTSKLEFHNGTAWADLGTDIAGISAGGDLSGTYPNPSVAKIQGTAVSATAPASGTFLNYNGSNWAGTSITLSDLKSTGTGTLFVSPGCTSAQSLYWESGTDTFKCQAIGALDASSISTGTIASARLPAGASAWDAIAGGLNYAGGKVGIGSASPVSALDVNGAIAVNGVNGISFPPDFTANSSLAVGSGALRAQAVGGSLQGNTAVGSGVMSSATFSGNSNTGVGYAALQSNTSGVKNVALGSYALNANTGGQQNVALGTYALSGTTIGQANMAIGHSALSSNISGSNNVGIGLYAGQKTTASNNTFIGYWAGQNVTSGASNLALGYNVGTATLATGSNNILIGTHAGIDTPAASTSNFMNLGNAIFATSLGSSGTTPAGNVGIGTSAPGAKLDVAGTVNATAYNLNGAPFTPGSTSATVPATGGSASSSTQSGTNAATGDRSALTLRNNGTGGSFEYNLIGQNAAGTNTSYIKQDGSAYFGGNISIGTTASSAPLTVGTQGELARFGTTGDFDAYLNFQNGRGYLGYDDAQYMILQAGASKGVKLGVNNSTWNSGTALTLSTTGTAAFTPANATDTSGTINNLSVVNTIAPAAASSAAVNGISSQLTTSGVNNFTGGLAGIKSYVNHAGSGTASDVYGIYSGVNQNHSSGTSTDAYGNYNDVTTTNGTTGNAYGVYNYIRNANAGTVGTFYGTYSRLRNVTGGAVTNAIGNQSYVENSGSGTITNGYGFYANSPTNSGAGSIANYYGLYIQNPTAATTNNYSIYSAGGLNYFAGNVGIGSTNPGEKLDIAGGSAKVANGFYYKATRNTGAAAINVLGFDSGTDNLYLRTGGASNGSALYIRNTANLDTVTFRNDGNVGIGTITPTNDLSFGGDANRAIAMERTTSNGVGKYLTIAAGAALGTDFAGGDLFLSSGTSTGTGGSGIQFKTATPSATGAAQNATTTKMIIAANGNVGIGATSATAPLHVNSTAATVGNPATTGTIQSTGQVARFAHGGAPAVVLDVGSSSTTGFWFQTANSGGLGTSYPIKLNPNGGNVGVGSNTAPTVALDVAGAVRAGSSVSVTTCGSGQAAGEGSQRYNYTSYNMEYCNGTSWVALAAPAGQGLAKAWAKFNWTGSAINVASSFNVGTITRTSAGLYQVNFSSAMADANYVINVTCQRPSANNGVIGAVAQGVTPTTANFSVSCADDAASPLDAAAVYVTVFGN